MRKNAAITAAVIMALILGNALVGTSNIGYHPDCTDGIDNNGDSFIDGDDPNCVDYPWADGNGELETTTQPYFDTNSGYRFYSDYITTYMLDEDFRDSILCQMSLIGGTYHDADNSRATEIIDEENINCNQGGP